MDTNEFEQRARRQSFRPVPDEWREQMLGVARKAPSEESRTTHYESRHPWWRELLWPCPQAWAGLAAAWALILIFNATTREAAHADRRPSAPASPEVLRALREQKDLFTELFAPSPSTRPPVNFVPRPRSEASRQFISV